MLEESPLNTALGRVEPAPFEEESWEWERVQWAVEYDFLRRASGFFWLWAREGRRVRRRRRKAREATEERRGLVERALGAWRDEASATRALSSLAQERLREYLYTWRRRAARSAALVPSSSEPSEALRLFSSVRRLLPARGSPARRQGSSLSALRAFTRAMARRKRARRCLLAWRVAL